MSEHSVQVHIDSVCYRDQTFCSLAGRYVVCGGCNGEPVVLISAFNQSAPPAHYYQGAGTDTVTLNAPFFQVAQSLDRGVECTVYYDDAHTVTDVLRVPPLPQDRQIVPAAEIHRDNNLGMQA